MMNPPNHLADKHIVNLKSQLQAMKKHCKKCSGKGFIITNHEDGYYDDCENCTKKILRFEKYLRAGIMNDYLNVFHPDTKSILTPEVYKRFADLVAKVTRLSLKFSLIIFRVNDDHSFGTSLIGNILLKQFVDENYDGYVIRFGDFLNTMFDFGGTDEENKRAKVMYEYISSIPVLYIEGFANLENCNSSRRFDVGSFGYKKMAIFLNLRKMAGKFTMISCDIDRHQFEAQFKGAIQTLIEVSYLPFDVQCITGKHKHSAVSKLDEDDDDISPETFTDVASSRIVTMDNKKISASKVDNVANDDVLDKATKDRSSNGRNKR